MERTISKAAVVAAAGAIFALALFLVLGSDSRAQASPQRTRMHMHGVVATKDVSAKELALRQQMRKLWEDHITWTRLVIVSFDGSLPDLQATEGRLLQNQADIGRAVASFYGPAAGKRLTALLRSHILIAADVLAAAKAGDQAGLASAQKRWSANGRQIAAFLTKANPGNWPAAMTNRMMRRHLELTTREAVAHLQGRWPADIAAYDAVHREILQMADMLSQGIIRQFPARFH